MQTLSQFITEESINTERHIMKSLVECLKSSEQDVKEGLIDRTICHAINKYKPEFDSIIKPYLKELLDEKKCPNWSDMLSWYEESERLEVILLYDRSALFSEIQDIIPSSTDGHKLVKLMNKIEKLVNFPFRNFN